MFHITTAIFLLTYPNKCRGRTNFARDIAEQIRQVYGTRVHIFKNCIPLSVRAAETTAEGKSIYLHDPKGIVAKGYVCLTEEVLAHEE